MHTQAAVFLNHLRNARYAELDDALANLQRRFEHSEVQETDLKQTFSAFQTADPLLGEKFGKWLEGRPNSYVAHTAFAEWLLARAWAYRGHSTANLVSDQGLRGLHYHLQQAETCARQATNLTANPLAAWLVVAYTRNTHGCELTLEEIRTGRYPDWFSRPLIENPHSLEVRLAMLYHLRAEWGGSEKHMLTFVRQQQDAGQLAQGDMQKLWAAFHAAVSHHALHFADDPDLGVERARLAADLQERRAEQLFVALTQAKRPQQERRAALERFLTAAEQDLSARPEGNFLWALLHSKEWLESLLPRLTALLLRWAESGHQESAVALGYLRLLDRNWTLPDPVPLLMEARDQGDKQAAETLVRLQEASLGWQATLRDTPETRDAVLKAADLGSEDMSWRVYQNFGAYRKQFGLNDRDRYRYLLRAADAGNNDARLALAQQLRGGLVELGEDGVLRPVDTRPIQESLDYAKHLLERAAAQEHGGARRVLGQAKEKDWDAKTARRLRASAYKQEREAPRGLRWWQWWLLGSVLVAALRACAAFFGPDGAAGPVGFHSPTAFPALTYETRRPAAR